MRWAGDGCRAVMGVDDRTCGDGLRTGLVELLRLL